MSGLTVRFWGTRGAIPTPGRSTEKYGGNTTCLELRHHDDIVVLDAGSGLRALGDAWEDEFGGGPVHAHLLLTHLHWDHIQGFPFFGPAYHKGNALVIHGQPRPQGSLHDLLGGQMQGSYFPVPFSALQADLTFLDTTAEFEIGSIKLRAVSLPHPGGCLGYRLEADGLVFVFATDSELDLAAQNRDEVQADHRAPRRYDPHLLSFFRGAHMLVVDCQYTDEEYPRYRGWGHNSVATVADLCRQAGPEVVVLTHHDPHHGDDAVAALAADAAARLRGGPLVLAARERLAMRVGTPPRPLPLV